MIQYSKAGKELWPTPASTLLASFMAGKVSEAIALITWDAAAAGWAALARWWEHQATGKVMREQLMIGTWPAEAAIEEQPHRETWAGCLALEALSKLIDLHAFAILMRNDTSAKRRSARAASALQPSRQLLFAATNSAPNSTLTCIAYTSPALPSSMRA